MLEVINLKSQLKCGKRHFDGCSISDQDITNEKFAIQLGDSNLEFYGCEFRDVTFCSETDLLHGAFFYRCRFYNVKFENFSKNYRGVRFILCDIILTDIEITSNVSIELSQIDECDITRFDFQNLEIKECTLIDVSFMGAILDRDSILENCNFFQCEMRNSNANDRIVYNRTDDYIFIDDLTEDQIRNKRKSK